MGPTTCSSAEQQTGHDRPSAAKSRPPHELSEAPNAFFKASAFSFLPLLCQDSGPPTQPQLQQRGPLCLCMKMSTQLRALWHTSTCPTVTQLEPLSGSFLLFQQPTHGSAACTCSLGQPERFHFSRWLVSCPHASARRIPLPPGSTRRKIMTNLAPGSSGLRYTASFRTKALFLCSKTAVGHNTHQNLKFYDRGRFEARTCFPCLF